MKTTQHISKKIIHYLEKNSIIDPTTKDIYIYCIDFTLDLIFFNISLLLLGCLLHEPFMALLYIVTMTPLKMICGGAHASTQTLCSIISYFLFFSSILFSIYIESVLQFHVPKTTIFILCIISIIAHTPVDTPNKRYMPSQKAKLKLFSGIYCTMLFIIFIILKECFHEKYCSIILIDLIIIAINQYIGIIINRKEDSYESENSHL